MLLPAAQGAASDGPPAHAHWAGVDWTQDAEETQAAIAGDPPGWLIMDHYAFDERWQKAVLPAGAKLMVIDDLADRPHVCDLLLDQNMAHTGSDYDGLVPEECTRLVGPRYALLRPEFAYRRSAALARREVGQGLRHLLVTMGGVDYADATSAVLEALRDAPLPKELRITVVMGSQAPALDKVRTLAAKMPRPAEVAVDVADMAALMADADLAIGAGGGTTWERCALGLPTIIVETAENQAGIAAAMVDAGAALTPGQLADAAFGDRLRAALAEAGDPARLAALSQNAAEICDGGGVGRIMAVLNAGDISFRPATRADSRRVWEWRRTVGKSARMTDEDTPYSQHDAWFCRAIKDPEINIYIAMLGDLPCGYLRLDCIEETLARVSVCLSSEVRGRGLGRRLLVEADRLGELLGFERLEAEIHPENAASRHIFEAAGYVQRDMQNGFAVCHRFLREVT